MRITLFNMIWRCKIAFFNIGRIRFFGFGVFQFGVGYAHVVDGGELGFEHLADACDVAEGEVAVVELGVIHLF